MHSSRHPAVLDRRSEGLIRCPRELMELAIVGLRAAGKTAVFQALTAGHGSGQMDARGEHVGAVKIPDERLNRLAALVKAKKVTPLEVLLYDLPPLFERGAGPSGQASESLARAEVLLHVVRAFERADVPHPAGSIDPARDIEAFDGELMINDLGVIDRRLEKLEITVRSARPGDREGGEREKALLKRCRELLEAGRPLRNEITDAPELKMLSSYGLLSLKPMMLLINLDEGDAGGSSELKAGCERRYGARKTASAAACAKLEAELAELAPEEAAEFRRELGPEEGMVEALLGRLMELLGLITFFTVVGDKEARAWSAPAGTPAVQAAGRIHTDMERGFIRAEVISSEKLLECGSHAEARRRGQLRTEGRQYLVQDGDVINVLFSV